MSTFLEHEEGRVGIETQHTNTDKDEPPEPPVNQSHVLNSVQDTFEETVKMFIRSRDVIKKLHTDCSYLATLNAEIMSKVKDCDSIVRHILEANKITASVKPTPRTAYDMFNILMEDINTLVQSRSELMNKEREERTQSMRLLRLCRDNVDERNSILKNLHQSSSSVRNLQQKNHLVTYKHNVSDTRYLALSSRGTEDQPNTPIQRHSIKHDEDSANNIRNNIGDMTVSSLNAERLQATPVQTHPIKTVLDGLKLLELQLREYVHNEIMLTDKYKLELRIKKLERKSQGFAPHGFANSNQLISCIERGEDVAENALKLKVILDKVSEEYEECIHYLTRASRSLTIKTNMNDPVTLTHRDERKIQKKSEMGSFLSFFRKKPEFSEHRVTSTPVPTLNQVLQLPLIIKDHTIRQDKTKNQTTTSYRSHRLVDRLKTLVASYEDLKSDANFLKQKFRLDWERKNREMNNKLRLKEDEVVRLQLCLKEVTSEKDKFKRLYERARFGAGKK